MVANWKGIQMLQSYRKHMGKKMQKMCLVSVIRMYVHPAGVMREMRNATGERQVCFSISRKI